MLRRASVLVVLALALPTAAASGLGGVDPNERPHAETPVATVGFEKDGYLLFVDRAPGGNPGDDTVVVEQSLSYFAPVVRTADNPFFDGVEPPVTLSASLRDRTLHHPAFLLLRAADQHLLEGHGPADADAGEDGVSAGWDVAGQSWSNEDEPLAYPDQDTWEGVPVSSDDASVTLRGSWADSSDHLLDRGDEVAQASCLALVAGDPALGGQEHLCAVAPLAAFDPLLPNLVLRNELQHVEVKVNPVGAPTGGSDPRELLTIVSITLGRSGSAASTDASDEYLGFVDDALQADAANGGAEPGSNGGVLEPSATTLGAAAGDGPLLVLLALAGLGAALLAVPLYRRIVRGQILANDVRSRILALVQEQPGLHESAVAKALGISHTLAQYHVRMLAEFGLVEVRRFGGRKCLFAAGQMGRTEKTMLLAERGRSAQVVDLVAAQPGIAQRDLARALGIRESSVKWHLDRLEQHGVVLVERSLEGKRVRLTAEAEQSRLATFTRAAPVAAPAAEPRPEPAGPPGPGEPSPLHAASA